MKNENEEMAGLRYHRWAEFVYWGIFFFLARVVDQYVNTFTSLY